MLISQISTSFNFLDKTQAILSKMEDSEYNFYLTGSRLFGGTTPESDWDFFTSNLAGIQWFLKKLGFLECGRSYSDKITEKVYRFESPSGNIDVQMCTSVEQKNEVQRKLLIHCPHLFFRIPKEYRGHVWNMLLAVTNVSQDQYPHKKAIVIPDNPISSG